VREERNAPFWIHGVLPRPSLPCPSDNFDSPAAGATVPRPPRRSPMARRATHRGAEPAGSLQTHSTRRLLRAPAGGRTGGRTGARKGTRVLTAGGRADGRTGGRERGRHMDRSGMDDVGAGVVRGTASRYMLLYATCCMLLPRHVARCSRDVARCHDMLHVAEVSAATGSGIDAMLRRICELKRQRP
jgi:hypothetical protein